MHEIGLQFETDVFLVGGMLIGAMLVMMLGLIYIIYYILGRGKPRVTRFMDNKTVEVTRRDQDESGNYEFKDKMYHGHPEHLWSKEKGFLRGTRHIYFYENNPAPLIIKSWEQIKDALMAKLTGVPQGSNPGEPILSEEDAETVWEMISPELPSFEPDPQMRPEHLKALWNARQIRQWGKGPADFRDILILALVGGLILVVLLTFGGGF